MPDNLETSETENKVREFQIGEVNARQKARVTQLQHPNYGTTYLIDVTEQEDPTTKDPNDETSQARTVSEMLGGKLGNPSNHNRYASNNGVLALITERLDKKGNLKLYLGIEMADSENDDSIEIISQVLNSAGFLSGTFYVPLSFDSKLVRQHMAAKIKRALSESQDLNLFPEAQRLLL